MHYLINRSIQKARYIIADFIIHSGRKTRFHFLQFGLYIINHITCITAVVLFKYNSGRSMPVQIGINIKKLTAQLHCCYIF
ncbi:hypothetical protein D3C84_695450 [compost metagenome]